MISPAAWKKLGYTKAVGDFEVWLKRMGELSFTIRRIKRALPRVDEPKVRADRDAQWLAALTGETWDMWRSRLQRDGGQPLKWEEMLSMSKEITSKPEIGRERLVNFFYLLLRDEIAAGVIEGIVHRTEAIPAAVVVTYSNPHLEAYARELAGRLVP